MPTNYSPYTGTSSTSGGYTPTNYSPIPNASIGVNTAASYNKQGNQTGVYSISTGGKAGPQITGHLGGSIGGGGGGGSPATNNRVNNLQSSNTPAPPQRTRATNPDANQIRAAQNRQRLQAEQAFYNTPNYTNATTKKPGYYPNKKAYSPYYVNSFALKRGSQTVPYSAMTTLINPLGPSKITSPPKNNNNKKLNKNASPSDIIRTINQAGTSTPDSIINTIKQSGNTNKKAPKKIKIGDLQGNGQSTIIYGGKAPPQPIKPEKLGYTTGIYTQPGTSEYVISNKKTGDIYAAGKGGQKEANAAMLKILRQNPNLTLTSGIYTQPGTSEYVISNPKTGDIYAAGKGGQKEANTAFDKILSNATTKKPGYYPNKKAYNSFNITNYGIKNGNNHISYSDMTTIINPPANPLKISKGFAIHLGNYHMYKGNPIDKLSITIQTQKDKINQKIQNKQSKTGFAGVEALGLGFAQGLLDMPLAVIHPIKTANGLVLAAEHPGRVLEGVTNNFLKNPESSIGRFGGQFLFGMGIGKVGEIASNAAIAFGKTRIPLERITTNKVASGAEQFPVMKTTPGSADRLVEAFSNNPKKISDTNKPVGYHVSPTGLKGNKVGYSNSESPGLYLSPSASPNFARTTSGTSLNIMDNLINGITSNPFDRFRPKRPAVNEFTTNGVSRQPAAVRNNLLKSNQFLLKDAIPGTIYITNKFETGGGRLRETEGVLPPNTQIRQLGRAKYYTKINGRNVPIRQYETTTSNTNSMLDNIKTNLNKNNIIQSSNDLSNPASYSGNSNLITAYIRLSSISPKSGSSKPKGGSSNIPFKDSINNYKVPKPSVYTSKVITSVNGRQPLNISPSIIRYPLNHIVRLTGGTTYNPSKPQPSKSNSKTVPRSIRKAPDNYYSNLNSNNIVRTPPPNRRYISSQYYNLLYYTDNNLKKPKTKNSRNNKNKKSIIFSSYKGASNSAKYKPSILAELGNIYGKPTKKQSKGYFSNPLNIRPLPEKNKKNNAKKTRKTRIKKTNNILKIKPII